MKKFKVENLMNGFYNEVERTYDLEFTDGWINGIPAGEHPEAETDEHYWDNQETIDIASEQGEIILNDN